VSSATDTSYYSLDWCTMRKRCDEARRFLPTYEDTRLYAL